ncbi:MAG: cysteine rich repeat-containing protein [Desulfocapsaceae bacterium]
MMKLIFAGIAASSLALLMTISSQAQEDTLLDSDLEGCEHELTTYCKDVTPGQSRVLACLYAHDDKISTKCKFALYDATTQLEKAVAALSYMVHECADDLEAHCQGVEAGEGRLLDCLEKNESEVSARCNGALEEVGMK